MKAALIVSIPFVVACDGELSLEGRPCPCAGGWTCCAEANVCVREGASCPVTADDVASVSGRRELRVRWVATSPTQIKDTRCMTADARNIYWMNGDGQFFGIPNSGGAIESRKLPIPGTIDQVAPLGPRDAIPRGGLASDGTTLFATSYFNSSFWRAPLVTDGRTAFSTYAHYFGTTGSGVSSVAVDEHALYFTSYEDGTVSKIAKNSRGAAIVLVRDGVRPDAVALDDENVYWLDLGDLTSARVMKVSKAGGSAVELARTSGRSRLRESPYGVPLVVANGRVFWTEPENGRVMEIDVAGGAGVAREVARDLGSIGTLVTDGARLFVTVTETSSKRVHVILLSGKGEYGILHDRDVAFLVADGRAVHWLDGEGSLWSAPF